MNKVAFITLGCKVNQYETNGMIQKFIESGYEIVDENQYADVYVINTCTVTNIADRKSRQMLRRMKQHNPNAIIIASGCYVQVAKDELEKMDEIDLVIGNNEKTKIVELLNNFIKDNKEKAQVDDVMHSRFFSEFGDVTYTEKTRAVIKVQDGCDRFCSYCIIPFARGRVRSRKPNEVISEIEKVAKRGIKEVIITGIHVASYGKDFDNEYRLIDLLEEINKIDGIERIRLGSIEPLLINEKFINRLKELDKICHHFHLSLQSGCDSTLKRMNRRYTINEFKNIVSLLRNTYNDVMLTTDIIVGFPGEDDNEFNETYKFLSEIKFYKMHVFKYSPRKNTKAAEMEKQVSGEIKEERSKRLIELSNNNQMEYNKSYINKNVEVLFEEEKDGFIYGHTDNYMLVKCKGTSKFENQIVKVKCVKIEAECLICNVM